MTKRQYLNIVERELAYLNERIDRKIICGLGYGSEACRHKRLVGLTKELRKKSFFTRVFGLSHAR
jgi:hypothetical protein